MTCLCHLLGTHPSLLTPRDIHHIFSRTPSPYSPLRCLAITVLVAQLYSPDSTTNIEDFDDLLFKGAISLFYKAMRNWVIFSSKFTGPEEDTLLALLSAPAMVKLLNVPEDEPAAWVLVLCGIAPKAAAAGGVREEPIEVD